MLLHKIQNLPNCLIHEIATFFTYETLRLLNRENYRKYHWKLTQEMKTNKCMQKYIRQILETDNSFAFSQILQDLQKLQIQKYMLVTINREYATFYYFLLDNCIKKNAQNCQNALNSFFF